MRVFWILCFLISFIICPFSYGSTKEKAIMKLTLTNTVTQEKEIVYLDCKETLYAIRAFSSTIKSLNKKVVKCEGVGLNYICLQIMS